MTSSAAGTTTEARRSRLRPLARSTGLYLYRVVAWTFGVWAAAQLVPDFRLTGAPTTQLVTAATVAVIAAAGELVVRGLIRGVPRGLGRLAERAQRTLHATGDIWPLRRVNALGVVYGMFAVPVALVLPIVLALGPGVLLAQAFGLPVALPGGWAFVVASWVAMALAGSASRPLRWVGRGGGRRLMTNVVVVAVVVGVLWAAEVLLPGVWLAPDPGALPVVVMLIVLAEQTFWSNTERPVSRGWVLADLVLVGLQLWGVSWLSTYLVQTLHIAGFWTFALLSVILTGVLTVFAAAKLRLLGPDPGHDSSPAVFNI